MTSIRNHSYGMHILFVFVLFCRNLMVAGKPEDSINQYNEQITNILNEFDVAASNIQHTESSMKSTFRQSQLCFRYIDYLNELAPTLIDDKNRISQGMIIHLSPDCTDWDQITAGLLIAKHVFRKVLKAPIWSEKYIMMRLVNFENIMKRLQSDLKIVNDTAEMKYYDLIHSTNVVIKDQHKKCKDILDAMESNQNKLNNKIVRQVVSHLNDRKLDDAFQELYKINNYQDYIKEVVSKSLENNAENFVFIFKFIQGIVPALHRIQGYKALFHELGEDNNSTNFWILTQALNAFSHWSDNLRIKLVNEVNMRVQRNYLDSLILDINDHSSEFNSLDYIQDTLISAVYAQDEKRISTAIDFLHKLTRLSDRYLFLNRFLQKLKSEKKLIGKEMTRIIFEIVKIKIENRKSLSHLNYLQRDLEHNLPNNIKELMYKNLCIQNVRSREFLHAGAPLPEDNRRRVIYTSKKRNGNGTFLWNLAFINNGAKVAIINSKYGEFIYMDEIPVNASRILRSWIPSPMSSNKNAEFTLDIDVEGRHTIINDEFGQLFSTAVNNTDATQNSMNRGDNDDDDDYYDYDDDNDVSSDDNKVYDDDDFDVDDEHSYSLVFSENIPKKFSYRSKWYIGLCRLPSESCN